MRLAACMLLLPAILLSQWVRAGHCHQASAGRAIAPHVHFNFLSDAHTHDADDDGDAPHEDDAVYLPTALLFGWLDVRTADLDNDLPLSHYLDESAMFSFSLNGPGLHRESRFRDIGEIDIASARALPLLS